jgi:hypothetical protein
MAGLAHPVCMVLAEPFNLSWFTFSMAVFALAFQKALMCLVREHDAVLEVQDILAITCSE